MSQTIPLDAIRAKIRDLRNLADDLYADSEDFPALNRNLKRILASIAMLEIETEEVT